MTDKILFISLYEPSKAGERIGGGGGDFGK